MREPEPVTRTPAESREERRADQHAETTVRIEQAYGTPDPDFAYIIGGRRRISVDPKDQRARNMLLRGGKTSFSRNQFFIYACCAALPIDVFLDIGSNYGECLFALPEGCGIRSIGFEANASLVPFLRRSAELNPDLADLTILNRAISDQPDQVLKFFVDTAWSGKSSAVAKPARPHIQEVRIQTTTVDAELQLLGEVKAMLIKLDVEGFEAAAFAGAAKAHRDVPNILYLMEFDDDYLRRGGVDARTFLTEILTIFEVYIYSRHGLMSVGDYDALRKFVDDRGDAKIHVDLVLTKMDDPAFARTFRDMFVGQKLRSVRLRFWPEDRSVPRRERRRPTLSA